MTISQLLELPNTLFFIDTCFLMNRESRDWIMKDLIPLLRENQKKLIAPYGVIKEIEKHQQNKNKDVKLKANKGAEVMNYLRYNNYLEYKGSKHDPFTDQIFKIIFEQYRTKYNLVLFTQDQGLADDLTLKNASKSVRSKYKIYIGKTRRKIIHITTQPSDFRVKDDHGYNQQQPKFVKPRKLDLSLNLSRNPLSEGDTLYYKNGNRLTLGKAIAKGGEGEIFMLSSGIVTKIYKPDYRVKWRHEKINKMLDLTIGDTHITWPLKAVYDKNKQFVGYTMRHARGNLLQTSIFGKAKLQNNFPSWNRKDLIQLCITITQSMSYLHKEGILLGDINPYNFLIESPNSVYFVDVDSYQFEDYPCPVGSEPFRAAEITQSNYKEFLRTSNHEHFALAVLLFMILLPGKPPYSHQGGATARDNILKGKFPYVGKKTNIPPGPWAHIWSHLLPEIKTLFERAFIGSPSSRPSASEWNTSLKKYLKSLNHPTYPSELHIWPNAFRPFKNQKTKTLKCFQCHEQFTTSCSDAKKRGTHKNILCNKCIALRKMTNQSGGSNVTCINCHKLFQIPNHELIKNQKQQKSCDTCLEKKYSNRHCKQCKQPFKLSIKNIKRFLFVKGFNIPKKCPSCHNKSTQHNKNSTPSFKYNQPQRRQPPTPPPLPLTTWEKALQHLGLYKEPTRRQHQEPEKSPNNRNNYW